MNLIIRTAAIDDLGAVNEIYNQAVDGKSSTGDLRHITIEERRRWFEDHRPEEYPVLVAELNNRIAGWISLSPYRKGREGLKYTGEISYYIHTDFQGKGIGTELLSAMIQKAKALHFKTLLAILFHTNTGSIRLLEKMDFKQWGLLPGVIEIDGQTYSHLYYGLRIAENE